MPTLINGLEVEQVGDLIGGTASTDKQRAPAVPPPTPEWSPPYPGVGIHFGMSDDYYHSIHACSASGIKDLSMSSMDYWARSVLNPTRDDDDTEFKALGRAYHTRILFGRDVFERDYAPLLTQDEFEDLIVTVKQLREAIEKECEVKPKGSAKEPLIQQYLDAGGRRPIWDKEVEDWAKLHEGRTMISRKNWDRIAIAAAMIEKDPVLSKSFIGGYPEVALFWYDPLTGAPMKAKLDYLKLMALVDLKSFSNIACRPVQRAIDFTIANRKYYVPVVVYLEGIAEVKRLIRESGGGNIYQWVTAAETGSSEGCMECVTKDQREWAWQWAHQPEPEVLFIFQQTGIAPVTRGRFMTKGAVYSINDAAVRQLKRKWVACANLYECEPWVDASPITRVVDEAIPMSGTDFGDFD